MNSKLLGSIMIVAGTTIGAGMLLLPLKTAGVGFPVSLLELVAFYFIMLIPAYCIIELCQFGQTGASMATLVKVGLGKFGLVLNNVAFYMLVYSIIIAYFGGVSSILSNALGLTGVSSLVFKVGVSLFMGLFVMFSTRLADFINRVFFYVMIGVFIILVIIALVHLQPANLKALPISSKAIIGSVPVLYLVYGFHLILPSLNDYLEGNIRDLKIAVTVGLAIPFVLLVLWSLVINGLADQASLLKFATSGDVSVGSILSQSSNNKYIVYAVDLFSIGALVTSFIGIGLAILTTLRDLFKTKPDHNLTDKELVESTEHVKTRLNPFAAYVLAFIIPIIIMVAVPSAFAVFLGYASVLFCIQSFFLPMIALYVVRKREAKLYKEDKLYKFFLPAELIALLAFALLVLSFLGYFI